MVWHTAGLEYYCYSSLIKNNQVWIQNAAKKQTVSSVVTLRHSALFQHQRPVALTCVHQHRHCVPPGCHLRWATSDSEEHMRLCPSTEWSSVSWLWRTHRCQIRPSFSRLQNLEELLRTSFSQQQQQQQQPESGHCSVPFTLEKTSYITFVPLFEIRIPKEPPALRPGWAGKQEKTDQHMDGKYRNDRKNVS